MHTPPMLGLPIYKFGNETNRQKLHPTHHRKSQLATTSKPKANKVNHAIQRKQRAMAERKQKVHHNTPSTSNLQFATSADLTSPSLSKSHHFYRNDKILGKKSLEDLGKLLLNYYFVSDVPQAPHHNR
jgi:hypothetical protein